MVQMVEKQKENVEYTDILPDLFPNLSTLCMR